MIFALKFGDCLIVQEKKNRKKNSREEGEKNIIGYITIKDERKRYRQYYIYDGLCYRSILMRAEHFRWR